MPDDASQDGTDRGASPLAALETALADARAPRFTIGQAAELLGVAPWFLRRLDALDIVRPGRSDGDHRRYSQEQLRQAAEAKALMDAGVSTAGVRRVLELQARVAGLEQELALALEGRHPARRGHEQEGGDRRHDP